MRHIDITKRQFTKYINQWGPFAHHLLELLMQAEREVIMNTEHWRKSDIGLVAKSWYWSIIRSDHSDYWLDGVYYITLDKKFKWYIATELGLDHLLFLDLNNQKCTREEVVFLILDKVDEMLRGVIEADLFDDHYNNPSLGNPHRMKCVNPELVTKWIREHKAGAA